LGTLLLTSWKEGIDFGETFATSCKVSINQMFDCDCCLLRFKAEKMDVETAFLNPDVKKEIYIQVPQGLEVSEKFKKGAPALRFLKGLYGLKQAPRLWINAVNATLHRLNFIAAILTLVYT